MRGHGFSVYRLYIFATFFTALFMGGILGARIIDVDGLPIPGGAFVFPLTFSALVVLAELYGIPASWRLAQAGVVMLILSSIALVIVTSIPYGPFASEQSRAFDELFSASIPTFGFVAFSFALGESVGLMVYLFGARWGTGPLVWLRLTLVPMTSQMATSIAFIGLAYRKFADLQDVVLAISARVIFAAIFATATAPLLMLAIRFIRSREVPPPIQEPDYPEDLR